MADCKNDITMAIVPHAGAAAGTFTCFAPLIAGAKTVMLEEFTPKRALELIEKEKAAAIGVLPTHLVRMLEADYKKYDLDKLRTWIRLSPDELKQVAAALKIF